MVSPGAGESKVVQFLLRKVQKRFVRVVKSSSLVCKEGPKGGAFKTPRTTRFPGVVCSQVHNPQFGLLSILKSLELAGHLQPAGLPQLIPLDPIRLKHVPLVEPRHFRVLIHQLVVHQLIEEVNYKI